MLVITCRLNFAETTWGVALLPKHLIEEYLQNGIFVRVLESCEIAPSIYGIYFNREELTTATKEFFREFHHIV